MHRSYLLVHGHVVDVTLRSACKGYKVCLYGVQVKCVNAWVDPLAIASVYNLVPLANMNGECITTNLTRPPKRLYVGVLHTNTRRRTGILHTYAHLVTNTEFRWTHNFATFLLHYDYGSALLVVRAGEFFKMTTGLHFMS